MVEDHKKNRLLMLEGTFAALVLIFLAAFAINQFFPTAQVPIDGGTPGIVGFVPIDISNQQIDLSADKPTSFVLFSEREEQFLLTSFRLSGEVIGAGRVEITLDNGIGQELLIYSNVRDRQGNLITGMATSEGPSEGVGHTTESEDEAPTPDTEDGAWFKITLQEDLTTEGPTRELTDDEVTVSGAFKNSCTDTCYINMKMRLGLYYTLKVKTDPGTQVKINELTYTLDV